MSNISTWFNAAAGNNALTPPDGAPENGTTHADLNNIMREMQASIRREFNNGGWFEFGDGSGPYAAVFLTSSSFQIQGIDVTGVYASNTRVRITQGATVLIGIISASAFTAGDTDVAVILESGVISNATIDNVEIGNTATPNPTPVATEIKDTDRDTFITVEDTPDDDRVKLVAEGTTVALASIKGTQHPLQPGFSYTVIGTQADVSGAGARYLIPFPVKNFERGTMMNASFNTMTAVLDGIYDIDVLVTLADLDESGTSINLDIERSDGVFWRQSLDPVPVLAGAPYIEFPVHQSRKIEMVAGQTLQVFVGINGMAGNTVDILGSTDRNLTEFSAWLLG